MSTDRAALETELAALIERDKPKDRIAAVKAEIAKLPETAADDDDPQVETATVEAPENTSRPKARPRGKAK